MLNRKDWRNDGSLGVEDPRLLERKQALWVLLFLMGVGWFLSCKWGRESQNTKE